MLSMDDVSAGFFESGNATVLSEILNIDPKTMNSLKSVANAASFIKGLHSIIDDAVKAADKPNEILEFATILVDELELVLDIKTISEPESED